MMLFAMIAVVGEEYEARGMVLEPADGKNAVVNAAEKIPKGTASFGIAHGRNNLGRFVHRKT